MLKTNRERNIEWRIATLPHVYGDHAMLRLVWMNLLINAVKFTRTREKPIIEINVLAENDAFIFSIHDNGVGFDMIYAQKLFGVFQHFQKEAKKEKKAKKAKEALRESEEKYRVLFEGSTFGILAIDGETHRFLYFNPAICRIFGYSDEEFLRLTIPDLHPKVSMDLVISEFESQMRWEKVPAYALPCLRKDGTVFYADINPNSIKNIQHFKELLNFGTMAA